MNQRPSYAPARVGQTVTNDTIHDLAHVRSAYDKKAACEALYAAGRTDRAARALIELVASMPETLRSDASFMDWLTGFTNTCAKDVERLGDEAVAEGRFDDALAAYGTFLSLGRPHVAPCRVADVTPDRCPETLERLVQTAMEAENYAVADEHLSTLLLLDDDVYRADVLIRRSKVRARMGAWADALSDADEAIEIRPSSHSGYEQRYAVLHGAGDYDAAVDAFDTMLAKLEQSPHEAVRALRSNYIDPRPTIRSIVRQRLRRLPHYLILTTTGQLYDREAQAAAFETASIWNELVSHMTTELDYARIWRAVQGFYAYVTLSHTWDEEKSLFKKLDLTNVSMYDLQPFPTVVKLRGFCGVARALNFRWAWADVACIDQGNKMVLHNSLVAMFSWYRGSSVTLVHLGRVFSNSDPPTSSLWESRWNSRGWTYQEYVASENVQFYNDDWTLYRGLTLANHKESDAIISEMEQATGISADQLAVPRPGPDRIREKLYVASMRQTTRPEDAAYSLFGIFDVSIPIMYGEGDRAVGRLLEHILGASGDVSILAWTGHSGSYNSCLPVDLKAYRQLVPPHIARPIEATELESTVTALRSSLADAGLAETLYNELVALPPPSMMCGQLRLSGIVCAVTKLVRMSHPDPVYQLGDYLAATTLFGDVVIRTADDLMGMGRLCLMHPWICALFDLGDGPREDSTTRALQFLARLRQPFGALLLAQRSPVEYERVAADVLIMVQFRDKVLLSEMMGNVCTLNLR